MLPVIPFVLGLSFLSGLNLYLATFLAGLAVRLEWVDPALLPALELLGHPVVMGAALVLLLVEFVVDKIPWIDSGWDVVHTVIRPVGAASLAAGIFSAAGMGVGGVAALATISGALALVTHLTKSGFRLLLNASPEPVTNILASLGEDVVVAGLALWLIFAPFSGFAVCLGSLALTWVVLPKMFRLIRTSLFLLWRKIFPRPQGAAWHSGPMPHALTSAQQDLLRAQSEGASCQARWAVSCVSGRLRHVPGARSNRFGTLVSLADQPGVLFFLTKGWFHRKLHRISLAGADIRTESAWLSEQLTVQRAGDDMQASFRFMKAEAPLVARLAADLQVCLGQQPPASTALVNEFAAVNIPPMPGEQMSPAYWGSHTGTSPRAH